MATSGIKLRVNYLFGHFISQNFYLCHLILKNNVWSLTSISVIILVSEALKGNMPSMWHSMLPALAAYDAVLGI